VKGIKGIKGNLGAKGVKGIKGATGAGGDKGPQGNKGVVGAKGNKGIVGNTAPQGAQGASPQGPQGGPGNSPKGIKGNIGASPQGNQGPQGNVGAPGDKGPRGNTGAQGNQPLVGITGDKGPKGAKGDIGPNCFLFEAKSGDDAAGACAAGEEYFYSDNCADPFEEGPAGCCIYYDSACSDNSFPQDFWLSNGTSAWAYDAQACDWVDQTACGRSDSRIKRGVKTLENPIGNIMKLEPMEYTWKKGTKEYDMFGEKEEIGFIAQQIEKIYPEIVINKKDGYLSLMYNRLTSILIEGIRHQQNDLVSVNDEISKLEILLGNE
jgi:hypothetical protein